MKLLITGANGQVGWELQRRAKNNGHEVHAFDKKSLNIVNKVFVEQIIEEIGPEVIINAAAYTAVDRAEEEIDKAFTVNREGPKLLASVCHDQDIPLIHLSTDYIFNGDKVGAYSENDSIAPPGVYGQSKYEGEELIRETIKKYIIIRVSWVFGAHGNNFVKTIRRLARERETIRIVDDQRGCPTPAVDIAEVILTLVTELELRKSIEWGTYHYCGVPVTTWYEFAQTIVEILGQSEALGVKHVKPIKTSDYPTQAKRPANSVLDCNRIKNIFGIEQRPWQPRLKEMLEELANRRE